MITDLPLSYVLTNPHPYLLTPGKAIFSILKSFRDFLQFKGELVFTVYPTRMRYRKRAPSVGIWWCRVKCRLGLPPHRWSYVTIPVGLVDVT